MKHIKLLALVGALLAMGACSVKGPSLEEQFLANFNGYSSAVALDGKVMPIGEGGLKLENFKLASVQSSAEAIYAADGFFPVPYKVVFVSKDMFLIAGGAADGIYVLGNGLNAVPGLPDGFPGNLPGDIPGFPPSGTPEAPSNPPSDTPETPEETPDDTPPAAPEELPEDATLEQRFLANFRGYSKIVNPWGSVYLIEDGGRTLGEYTFSSAQSATEAEYVYSVMGITNKVVFPSAGKLKFASVDFTLEK